MYKRQVLNSSIDVAGGVIDRDYMGNIRAIIVNTRPWPYYVHRGDKIAQIIIEKYVEPKDVVDLETYISVYFKDFNENRDISFGSTSN